MIYIYIIVHIWILPNILVEIDNKMYFWLIKFLWNGINHKKSNAFPSKWCIEHFGFGFGLIISIKTMLCFRWNACEKNELVQIWRQNFSFAFCHYFEIWFDETIKYTLAHSVGPTQICYMYNILCIDDLLSSDLHGK